MEAFSISDTVDERRRGASSTNALSERPGRELSVLLYAATISAVALAAWSGLSWLLLDGTEGDFPLYHLRVEREDGVSRAVVSDAGSVNAVAMLQVSLLLTAVRQLACVGLFAYTMRSSSMRMFVPYGIIAWEAAKAAEYCVSASLIQGAIKAISGSTWQELSFHMIIMSVLNFMGGCIAVWHAMKVVRRSMAKGTGSEEGGGAPRPALGRLFATIHRLGEFMGRGRDAFEAASWALFVLLWGVYLVGFSVNAANQTIPAFVYVAVYGLFFLMCLFGVVHVLLVYKVDVSMRSWCIIAIVDVLVNTVTKAAITGDVFGGISAMG